jgi:hypothetical protein
LRGTLSLNSKAPRLSCHRIFRDAPSFFAICVAVERDLQGLRHVSARGDARRLSGLSEAEVYFFFSPSFNVGAAAIVFGFTFLGFFASLLLRC